MCILLREGNSLAQSPRERQRRDPNPEALPAVWPGDEVTWC